MDEILRQNMAKKLVKLREAKGKSREQVAVSTGISYSALVKYELGLRTPKDESKLALADYFGVGVEDIFYLAD